MTKVKRASGKIEDFNKEAIYNDLKTASNSAQEIKSTAQLDRIFNKILDAIKDYKGANTQLTSDEIQDIVEGSLQKSAYKLTAKEYILNRDHKKQAKEIAGTFNSDLITKYIKKTDWKVNENSNMGYSLQGLNNYIASEVCKTYWLNKVYTTEIKNAHVSGDMHIHDLNSLSTYCVGWDLYDLLISGFTGVNDKVESAPAKHFRTALGQIVNFFYTLQGESAGAQAFSNVDTLLAPFIAYDNLSKTEIKQALQEFVFNCNVPTRVGFQTPFTNITLDLTVPSYYKSQGVVIGGKAQDKTYSEFQAEMDMFNNALMEIMSEGDAKGRVFTFPIPTYNITKDFDWENPNLDNLWKMTGKYGVPYFANFINSDMSPDDARSMCCRLRIDNRELNKRGGGLFGASPLTGSIGVVTVNLPRLAVSSKTEKEFFDNLTKMLDVAKDSLEIKRGIIEQLTNENLYPYTKFYLRSIKTRFNSYWKNHFSTIGIIGMHECCLNFLGAGITEEKGKEFAEDVLDFIKERLVTYQKETGNNYNLEATPAEGVTYRFALIDKKQYPDMKFACSCGEPYYTNSTQVPVDYSNDIFEVLDHQNSLQAKYTGGTVVHIFIGEKIDDINTIKSFVRKVCEKYNVPYFTLTPTFSVCKNHGYVSGEHQECPQCNEPAEVYSRIVGYLRPVSQWNKGKKSEFLQRKTYGV